MREKEREKEKEKYKWGERLIVKRENGIWREEERVELGNLGSQLRKWRACEMDLIHKITQKMTFLVQILSHACALVFYGCNTEQTNSENGFLVRRSFKFCLILGNIIFNT